MTRRPLVSVSARTPSPPTASVICFSTDAASASVSTTSSREACWMPILTSMEVPSVLLWEWSVVPRVAADAPPGEPGDQGGGVLAAHLVVLGEPVPGADLGHADQRHGEQPGRLVGQAGVLVDHRGDHRGALGGDPLDVVAHGAVVGEVGLEDQAERAVLARDVVVEDRHRSSNALLVVVGGVQCQAAV